MKDPSHILSGAGQEQALSFFNLPHPTKSIIFMA